MNKFGNHRIGLTGNTTSLPWQSPWQRLAGAQDVVQTSAVEGEMLNVASVRSSVARRLGVDIGAVAPVDRHIEGVVDNRGYTSGKAHFQIMNYFYPETRMNIDASDCLGATKQGLCNLLNVIKYL